MHAIQLIVDQTETQERTPPVALTAESGELQLTVAQLKTQAAALLSDEQSVSALTYVDSDGDQVTLASDADLKELLDYMNDEQLQTIEVVVKPSGNAVQRQIKGFVAAVAKLTAQLDSTRMESKPLSVVDFMDQLAQKLAALDAPADLKTDLSNVLGDAELRSTVEALSKSDEYKDMVQAVLSAIEVHDYEALEALATDKLDDWFGFAQRVLVECPQLKSVLFRAARAFVVGITEDKKTQTETSSVMHEGVVCDGCEMSPLVGVRYKALHERDFDLCAACESSGQWQTHEPFIKINDSSRGKRGKRCAERCADMPLMHPFVTCDGCEMSPIVGARYKSLTASDFDLCESCMASGAWTESHGPFGTVEPSGDLRCLKKMFKKMKKFGHHGHHEGRHGHHGHHGGRHGHHHGRCHGPPVPPTSETQETTSGSSSSSESDAAQGSRSFADVAREDAAASAATQGDEEGRPWVFFGHGGRGGRFHGGRGGHHGPHDHHHGPHDHHHGPPHGHHGPPHGHHGPPHGHHGPPSDWEHHGRRGPHGPFGHHGSFGHHGPPSDGEHHGRRGPHGPFGHQGPFGPHGPFGHHGHRRPFGNHGPFGRDEWSKWKGDHARFFQAKFVSDVTIPDGTVVSAGVSLRKAWKLQNDGDNVWPEGCVLVMQGGNPAFGEAAATTQIPLPSLNPGEECEAEAVICSPTVPGRYTSYWRVCDPAGNSFGHRFWIDILVADVGSEKTIPEATPCTTDAVATQVINVTTEAIPEAIRVDEDEAEEAGEAHDFEVVEATPVTTAQAEGPFEHALAQLVAMGFTDEDKNRRVLETTAGNIGEAVNALLSE